MKQTRKQYSLEEKHQHVVAWRASGLTRQQYSELHDIKFSTFREWPQDIKTRVSKDSAGLIPVHIATDSYACGELIFTEIFRRLA